MAVSTSTYFTIYRFMLYIYIHQVMLIAWIPLTLSRHLSLSSVNNIEVMLPSHLNQEIKVLIPHWWHSFTPYPNRSFTDALTSGKFVVIWVLNAKMTILKKINVSFIVLLYWVNTDSFLILFEHTIQFVPFISDAIMVKYKHCTAGFGPCAHFIIHFCILRK